MIKLIKRIINHFELKKVRKELVNLDKKYYATVWSKWKEKGYTDSVSCFPNIGAIENDIHYVSLSKGIDLVIANNEEIKNIFLMGFTKKDTFLVKKYIMLKGFSTSNIKTESISD